MQMQKSLYVNQRHTTPHVKNTPQDSTKGSCLGHLLSQACTQTIMTVRICTREADKPQSPKLHHHNQKQYSKTPDDKQSNTPAAFLCSFLIWHSMPRNQQIKARDQEVSSVVPCTGTAYS
jgi:hypothetical protein